MSNLTPALIGAIVTLLGIAGTYLGIRVTVKGTRKSKEIDARVASEQQTYLERKESYDQVQENLSGAWDEARKLRKELEDTSTRYRNEIAELWRQIADIRRQADYELLQIRAHYRAQKEDDDAYITTLIAHIETRKPPPAPQRPAPRSTPLVPPTPTSIPSPLPGSDPQTP